MNTVVKLVILLMLAFTTSCTEGDKPIDTGSTAPELSGEYAGVFTIIQGPNIQHGTTTLTFFDSTYTQVGEIESPSIIDFSDEGTYTVIDNNLQFNAGRENLMAVFPNWSMSGYFNCELNDNTIILNQELPDWQYEIELTRID